MKKMLLPLIVACCLAPAAAFAGLQHPLITENAESVEPGHFESETGIEYHKDKADGFKAGMFLLQESIAAGIVHNVSAVVTVPYERVRVKNELDEVAKENGIGDMSVGVNWTFLHVGHTSLAVKPFAVLPTGDEEKGLGEGKAGYGAALIASLELNEQLAVDANFEYKNQGVKNEERFNEFRGSAAARYAVAKGIKAVCEVSVSKSDKEEVEEDVVIKEKAHAYATAGAIYSVTKNLDVDLGVRVGLTKESTDLGMLAGVTLKF